jgi:hypothetical protein
MAVLRGITQPGIRITLGDDFRWIVRSTMRQPHRMPVTIERC